MDFFEPPRERPTPPPWHGAPDDVLGVSVPAKRILARTSVAVIALTDITAYPSGCQFGIRMAGRQGDIPDDEWHRLRELFFHQELRRHLADGPASSDELLRCGVQFPDGSKATNMEAPGWDAPPPSAPAPPVFVESHGEGGGGGLEDVSIHRGFWLWPLPPPEPITFAIEWPALGIELIKTEIDGEAIVTAGRSAEPFWLE